MIAYAASDEPGWVVVEGVNGEIERMPADDADALASRLTEAASTARLLAD